ncbi:glycoside hydrolase family 32 protein [Salisaeta longa]|uniref:glycoside hydrolase family 32 protein n=1 Tax=Salisaeta longa TaxID=503170 RepID=UPI0003B655FD|nr:glycoside hydrolase family 32 protein [Salisaeta longa]
MLAALVVLLAAPAAAQRITYRPTYVEPQRPQYHFTPAINWMNDPNGLVYYNGEYHLFYQYNPYGIQWGHMSWGHAVSTDLVHWTHLPVAIPEQNGVMAFSGSAVVDHQNTSGFGTTEHPPMVAIYTGHQPTKQAQYLAYSTDRGRTWTTYEGNPVLDIGRKNFRDPNVFWYAPEQKWVMLVALPTEYKVQFYESKNLKDWTLMSTFGPQGGTGGIWECPDLFRLPVEGTNETRWVLEVDMNPGALHGGSGGQYFVGSFDGTTFTRLPTADTSTVNWVDYGKDFYAAIDWANLPDAQNRHVWIGWMNNWQYGEQIPTHPWRSAQSIPRRLALRRTDDGFRLVQYPVQELQQLRDIHRHLTDLPVPAGTHSLRDHGISGRALEIVATIDVGTAEEVGLKVRRGGTEETLVGVDVRGEQVFVDRSRSGVTDFSAHFAGRHEGPLPITDGRVTLRVFVDWSSVEVFADEGYTVITDRIFPQPQHQGVAVYAEGGDARIVSMDVWTLRSAWAVR